MEEFNDAVRTKYRIEIRPSGYYKCQLNSWEALNYKVRTLLELREPVRVIE